MPQDLQNSIKKLVNSLKNNGAKGNYSCSMLFSVIIHLSIWNQQNGNNSINNRNDVSILMRYYLTQRYRNSVPMPNIGAITDRLMREIDRTIEDVQTNANNLNVLQHIN